MSISHRPERKRNGQIIVLFALALTAIVFIVGLVIDGGNALAQRRASQNASDFSALAGARIMAEYVSGDTNNGTDKNVADSMAAAVVLNGGTPLTFGAPDGPRYVADDGTLLTYVGSGTIPTGAVGVSVSTTRTWTPFFLGLAGIKDWSASAPAVAKGGYAAGGPSGDVFPVGVTESFVKTYPWCPEGDVSTDPTSPCYPKHLTPGNLNVPGGFGWLKFGTAGKCSGFDLGMDPDGCDSSKPFLQAEIGPPPKSHGCCDAPSGDANKDRIGSLTGNKASADCDYYIINKITVTVPVWDYAGGTGANGWYHIVGFAGFQLTNCNGGKDIEGVLRRQFYPGPTTSTAGFSGGALAVQLIK